MMRPLLDRIGSALLPLCLGALLCSPLQAQEREPMPGERVRITSATHRGIFHLVAVDREVLELQDSKAGEVVRVPRALISRLAVDRGPRPRLEGAMIGLGLGFAVAGTGGAVVGLSDGDDPPCAARDWCIIRFTAQEKAAILGVAFGTVGGVAGIIIGAIAPGRRWRRVELPLDVSVAPERNGKLAISVAIPR